MTSTTTRDALLRAGRRVTFHMIQAAIEGLKAVEAVIEEIGSIGEDDDNTSSNHGSNLQRIEIE